MDSHAPSILIVDDEIDSCRNLADILDDVGYRVDIAESGEAALKLVERQRYDVALLDLMMPGMDGTALYSEIRRLRPATVACIVTAYPGHPRAVEGLLAGVERLIAKPVDCRELIDVIAEAVHRPLLLVVDDDSDLCANLQDVLSEQGYRVCIAENVANAMDCLVEDDFHILLLDVVLPDGNGDQVFRKTRERYPAACVVIMSGAVDMDPEIRQMSERGAKAVFRKPVDVPRLLAKLKSLRESGCQPPQVKTGL